MVKTTLSDKKKWLENDVKLPFRICIYTLSYFQVIWVENRENISQKIASLEINLSHRTTVVGNFLKASCIITLRTGPIKLYRTFATWIRNKFTFLWEASQKFRGNDRFINADQRYTIGLSIFSTTSSAHRTKTIQHW